ncbi:uncharacterized protein LOC119613618 [Lucilia sericata]|uniref:uncharacterized protein LOC119613618 n=1 Tax=Lucilia sericata TaxID=13632 RepID=UPI0018A82695|nr:uncharacterized protein LOC119613618 [Lucilia sericata]
MKTNQIFVIFVILFLTPSCFGRYNPNLLALEKQIHSSTSPQKQILVYAFDQLGLLGKEYIARSVQIGRNILKDESLATNSQPEVEKFKNDLHIFIEKYDNSNENVQTIWNLMEVYGNIVQKYFKMSEKKKTPETKLILGILKKYGCESNNIEFVMKFHEFADDLIKKFEESKEHMDKHSLEWLDHFKTLNKFGDRYPAIMHYIIRMN